MDEKQLADEFDRHRAHLRAVAHRMLGSTGEAEDAVQEAWLRLTRSDAERWRMRGSNVAAPLLVIAGAGSGKTNTLVRRVTSRERAAVKITPGPRAAQGTHDDVNQRGEAVQIHVSPAAQEL